MQTKNAGPGQLEKPLNQPMLSLSYYLLYLLLADEAERAGGTFVVVVKFTCQLSRSCSFFTSVGCSTAGASSNPFYKLDHTVHILRVKCPGLSTAL